MREWRSVEVDQTQVQFFRGARSFPVRFRGMLPGAFPAVYSSVVYSSVSGSGSGRGREKYRV